MTLVAKYLMTSTDLAGTVFDTVSTSHFDASNSTPDLLLDDDQFTDQDSVFCDTGAPGTHTFGILSSVRRPAWENLPCTITFSYKNSGTIDTVAGHEMGDILANHLLGNRADGFHFGLLGSNEANDTHSWGVDASLPGQQFRLNLGGVTNGCTWNLTSSVTSGPGLSNGFNYFAIIISNTAPQLYMNNILQPIAVSTLPGAVTYAITSRIGSKVTTDTGVRGQRFGDIRVYDTALTAAEVEADFFDMFSKKADYFNGKFTDLLTLLLQTNREPDCCSYNNVSFKGISTTSREFQYVVQQDCYLREISLSTINHVGTVTITVDNGILLKPITLTFVAVAAPGVLQTATRYYAASPVGPKITRPLETFVRGSVVTIKAISTSGANTGQVELNMVMSSRFKRD